MKILHWETLSFRSSSILKLFKHHLPTGGEIEEHRHDFHEIFWILSGEAEHEVNGERSRLRHGDPGLDPAARPPPGDRGQPAAAAILQSRISG